VYYSTSLILPLTGSSSWYSSDKGRRKQHDTSSASFFSESEEDAPPRPPPPSRHKKFSRASTLSSDTLDSEGSGYARVLNDAKKPPKKRRSSSSDSAGPGRPPLPEDDSSVDGYHSTKSGSESETTHEVITVERVQREVFKDGVPVLSGSSRSASSIEEVPPASIRSLHSSSDSVSWCAPPS
jgi:hypothetical protein